jgi:hypothetical protein
MKKLLGPSYESELMETVRDIDGEKIIVRDLAAIADKLKVNTILPLREVRLNFGEGITNAGLYLNVVESEGARRLSVIKLLPEYMLSEGGQSELRAVLEAVQVLDKLGVGPKIYGVVVEEGEIIGYAMQPINGDAVSAYEVMGRPDTRQIMLRLTGIGLPPAPNFMLTPQGVVANDADNLAQSNPSFFENPPQKYLDFIGARLAEGAAPTGEPATDRYQKVLKDRLGDSPAAEKLLRFMADNRMEAIARKVSQADVSPGSVVSGQIISENLVTGLDFAVNEKGFPFGVDRATIFVNGPFDQSNYEPFIHELVEVEIMLRIMAFNRERNLYAADAVQQLANLDATEVLTRFLTLRRAQEYRLTPEELYALQVSAVNRMTAFMIGSASHAALDILGRDNPLGRELRHYLRMFRDVPPRSGKKEWIEDYHDVLGKVAKGREFDQLKGSDRAIFGYVADEFLKAVDQSYLGPEAILRTPGTSPPQKSAPVAPVAAVAVPPKPVSQILSDPVIIQSRRQAFLAGIAGIRNARFRAAMERLSGNAAAVTALASLDPATINRSAVEIALKQTNAETALRGNETQLIQYLKVLGARLAEEKAPTAEILFSRIFGARLAQAAVRTPEHIKEAAADADTMLLLARAYEAAPKSLPGRMFNFLFRKLSRNASIEFVREGERVLIYFYAKDEKGKWARLDEYPVELDADLRTRAVALNKAALTEGIRAERRLVTEASPVTDLVSRMLSDARFGERRIREALRQKVPASSKITLPRDLVKIDVWSQAEYEALREGKKIPALQAAFAEKFKSHFDGGRIEIFTMVVKEDGRLLLINEAGQEVLYGSFDELSSKFLDALSPGAKAMFKGYLPDELIAVLAARNEGLAGLTEEERALKTIGAVVTEPRQADPRTGTYNMIPDIPSDFLLVMAAFKEMFDPAKVRDYASRYTLRKDIKERDLGHLNQVPAGASREFYRTLGLMIKAIQALPLKQVLEAARVMIQAIGAAA